MNGQSPLLDTTSAMRQTVMSREVLDSLPNRVDVWGVARVIPSVILSKVDVGGSESFLQSSATVHGSSNENGFLIDGMDVSNLDGNGTVAAMYLDPYAFEETNYQAGGAGSAVAQKGGLLFNMVTRTGTNKFHGGGDVQRREPQHGLRELLSNSAKSQILAAVPPTVLAANPNIVPGADILKIFDTGGWLAGPILQDKLWFSYSFHDQGLNQYLLASYNPDGTQVLDDNKMWTMGSKIAWQVTRTAQLSYFDNLQYKLIGHRNGGGTFAESRARNLNDKYPDVHQLKFTSTLSNRAVVDVSYSRFRADDKFGQEPEVKAGDISRFDAITNSYTVALPTYRDNAMHRDGLYTNMDIVSGRHDVRFGYQYIKGGEKSSAWSTSGMRAQYRSGVPDAVNTYNVPITSTSSRDSCRVRTLGSRHRALHPGQMGRHPQADGERRHPLRDQLRLAARRMPRGEHFRGGNRAGTRLRAIPISKGSCRACRRSTTSRATAGRRSSSRRAATISRSTSASTSASIRWGRRTIRARGRPAPPARPLAAI